LWSSIDSFAESFFVWTPVSLSARRSGDFLKSKSRCARREPLRALCFAAPCAANRNEVNVATIFWKNTSGGSWQSPSNWNTNSVPGAADEAVINAPGSYTVSSTTDNTVNRLSTSAIATLLVSQGTFTDVNGSGSSKVAGNITVADGAAFAFGGTLRHSGAINLGSLGNSTSLVALQDLTLNNSGTIDANATGSVALVIDTGNLVVNTGTLEADAGGGGLTIDDGVTNTAAAATNGLFADGANVNVVGAVTGGGAATIAGERNGCLHRRDQRHAEARPRPKLRRDCRRIGEHRPDRPRQFPVLGQSDDQQGHRHRRGEYHHQRYGDGRGVERHAGPVEPARQRVRGERFGLHAQV
jgi:hypothetical protein